MILATGLCLTLCILLVIYPYLIYPLVLKVFPDRPVARDPGHRCTASLLFCAFNEGPAMAGKIGNIEALKRRHPGLEVLAFDDGSQDDTFARLAARPDLLTVTRGTGRRGKAHGMKRLAAAATGEILIFTDANVLLAENAVDRLMAWYADPEVGGVCGQLQHEGADAAPTARVGALYWHLEKRLKRAESRSGNVMGADGAIFSIRRALYPAFPDTVLDDLTVSMAAVFAGKRLIEAPDVMAHERLVSQRDEAFARKLRIAARAFHTHLLLRPALARMTPLDRFKYTSRKLLRWFGGLFLVLAALLAVLLGFAMSATLGGVALALLVAAVLIAPRVRRGPVCAVTEIVLALLATLLGVLRAARGQTVVTWTPAQSRQPGG